MTLRNIFERLWSDQAAALRREMLADDVSQLVANETYLRLTLRAMRLREGRRLWTDRRPMLHSFVTAPTSDGGAVDVPMVADAGRLRDIAEQTQTVIIRDLLLFGPTPYLGGQVDLTCGLFSVSDRNYASDLLDVVGAVSSAAGVEPVAVARKLVEPIKQGVERLLGAADVRLVLGVRQSLTGVGGGPPATGHLVLGGERVGADRPLSVGGDGRLFSEGTEVDDDYFVIAIEALDRREDWQALPEISAALNEVSSAAVNNEQERLKRALAVFSHLVVTSPRLIESDQVRMLKGIKQRVASLQAEGDDDHTERLVAGGDDAAHDALERLVANAPSPAHARTIGVQAALAELNRDE